MFRLFMLCVLLLPSSLLAKNAQPIEDYLCEQMLMAESAKPSGHHGLMTVLNYFRELSAIYRPSGQEQAARSLVETVARNHGLHYEIDGTGNILVTVPATGIFAGLGLPSVALQSHLDMVLAVQKTGVASEDDPTVVFRNGVPGVVVEDGWIHSKNYKTSLGADNGVGVTMALRYMSDLTIPHPPLKLLFTIDEETGGTGAENLKIPQDIAVLLNLDGEEFGTVWNGCLGSCRVEAQHSGVSSVAIPNEYIQIQISLLGLKGGHSGLDIHEGRGNAVHLAAKITEQLKADIPEALVVEIEAGEKVLNKIPSSFTVTVAVPASASQTLLELAARFAGDVRREFDPIENPGLAPGAVSPIQVHTSDATVTSTFAIGPQDLSILTAHILSIPTGVLTHSNEPGFTNGMNLSSNLAYFIVKARTSAAGNSFEASYGMMPRAFVTDAIPPFTAQQELATRALPFANTQIQVPEPNPAWTPDAKAWIMDLFQTVATRETGRPFHVESAAGGLETAFFVKQNPMLQMISIGPDIEHPHTPKERANIESLARTIRLVDQLLISIGNDPRFRQP